MDHHSGDYWFIFSFTFVAKKIPKDMDINTSDDAFMQTQTRARDYYQLSYPLAVLTSYINKLGLVGDQTAHVLGSKVWICTHEK